jgi:phospholipid/cholesterol/gamma-HCH transport system substrate-binding protein
MLRSKVIKEGTLGLFILLGLLVFGAATFWLRGARFSDDTYQIIVQFENAGGVREGAKVSYRGVEVGRIIAINPDSNGVNIVLEIDSNLKIPKQVDIRTLRSGLLGEANVDITPQTELTPEAETINPLNNDCKDNSLIICNEEKVKGETSADLIVTLTRLSELYSDPVLFNDIHQAIKNISLASEKASGLSDDISDFTKDLNKNISKFSDTADAFSKTANITGEQVEILTNNLSATSQQINLLVANLNSLIDQNKDDLNQVVVNVNESTKQLNNVIKNIDFTVSKVYSTLDAADTTKIAKNLEAFSQDLKEISEQLNQDTNLVTLQETLDSARVTFENTAKITSDLDELTGDPEFRRNVRRLVQGLSSLVSYTNDLEQQIKLAEALESAREIAKNNSQTIPNILIAQEENREQNLRDKNQQKFQIIKGNSVKLKDFDLEKQKLN